MSDGDFPDRDYFLIMIIQITISSKNGVISSLLATVYFVMPPLCGLSSIQKRAEGVLSMKPPCANMKNPLCESIPHRRS